MSSDWRMVEDCVRNSNYSSGYVAKAVEELAAMLTELSELRADKARVDWLQVRYGERPWNLVKMIPGTFDVRVAIDRAVEWHKNNPEGWN